MKRTAIILLVLTVGIGLSSCKRKGCTDQTAINYDEKAKKDDGTCEYPPASTETLFEESGNIVTITDLGEGVGDYTMDSSKTYVLNGFVFVNSGQTLTITPGTTIKGKSGQGENASALVVAQGGMINACGTASDPIIFTSESDNGTLPLNARGLWGGVIILGNAPLNSSPGTSQIEGIPTTETRGRYGGTDAADNSGTLCYVSIRHGGTDIGAGNEINGLTLGGVGSGTSISNIEVVANADDGIEFFGGTPDLKNVIVSYCGDDAIDYDEGFDGRVQFALVYQDPADGDRVGEHDGGTTPEDGAPYATPVFYNVTYIGRDTSGANKRMLTFRDNAGGHYHNSIFMSQENGVDIEKLASGEDSYSRFTNNQLTVENNVFWNITDAGAAATGADIFQISFGSGASDAGETATFQAAFGNWGNSVADPGITVSPLNPVPSNSGNVSGGVAPTDSWFTNVTYQGAFDPTGINWASWTRLFE